MLTEIKADIGILISDKNISFNSNVKTIHQGEIILTFLSTKNIAWKYTLLSKI